MRGRPFIIFLVLFICYSNNVFSQTTDESSAATDSTAQKTDSAETDSEKTITEEQPDAENTEKEDTRQSVQETTETEQKEPASQDEEAKVLPITTEPITTTKQPKISEQQEMEIPTANETQTNQQAETQPEYTTDTGIIIEGLDEPQPTETDTLEVAKEPVVNFSGVLKEKGTKTLLTNLTVYLKDTEYEAYTDKNGYFEFYDLPPGTYNIIIPSLNHETFRTAETIKEGEATKVVYYLEAKSYNKLEVVVRGKKVKKEVSKQVISMEEAKVIPGTLGDAVKVVQNMPGVARGVSPAGLVIRGSNAEDSLVLLDGHVIPQLFHFGGLKSVYNSDFLEDINLYTGGFGVEYGNATGGIVNLTSKTPNLDKWSGYVDTSLIDATALAEGPLTKKKDMGLGLAFRRSLMDLIIPLVISGNDDFSFTTLPVYYDYQFKYYYKINKKHTLRIDWYGGLDKLKLVTELVNDSEPEFSGQFGFQTMFHSLVLHYDYKTDKFKSSFSPGFSYTVIDASVGNDLFFNLDAYTLKFMEDVSINVTKTNTINFGVNIEPRTATIKSNLILPPKEGDVDISVSNSEKIRTDTTAWDWLLGAYINDEIKLGRVLVIPGIRFDYYTHQKKFAFSPRAAVRYNVIDPVTLKLAAGLYHRAPDPDESYEPYGNTGLEFERAVHVIGGIEWNITDALSLDVQGYYKYLDNLVNRISGESEDGRTYDNSGKGYVYGGEILLRHSFSKNFFGWISYSINRAMRNDGPGTPYRLFDLDQTHNLIVVASYKFLKTWRIGGRFQLSSGEPYTLITGSIFNSDNGTYLPLYDDNNKNSERTGLYHKFDIRLDKDFVFDTWILSAYLDIQNVYYHSNPVAVIYNYDYSEKTSFKTLPILPSIGIKASF